MSQEQVRMNVRRFAQLVGQSERQVYRWIKAKKLIPRRTPGGRPFFLQDDVDNFLNGGRRAVRSRS